MPSIEDFTNANPDFRFSSDIAAVIGAVPAELRELGWVARLLQYLGDRDRAVEDYLNRHVVRRVESVRVLGNGTAHTGTAWQLVAPAVDVFFEKANGSLHGATADPASHLTAWVAAAGLFSDAGAPSWVEFGLLVNGVDYPVVRRICSTTAQHYQWAGSVDIANANLVTGRYQCSLRVRGQNAATTFTSSTNGSLSVTITESA